MKTISIKLRILIVIGLLSALLITIGFVGLRGMADADDKLESVYQDRLVPAVQIAEIDGLMRENIMLLNLAAMHDPRLEESKLHDHPITLHTHQVQQNIDRITAIWDEYMRTDLTEDEAQMAQEFAGLRRLFVQNGLRPAIELYNRSDFAQANTLMVQVTNPAFHAANRVANDLEHLQISIAEEVYNSALVAYERTRNFAIFAIVGGVLLAAVMGWLLIRAIVNPLQRTTGYFAQIAHGQLDNEIVITQQDEIGKVLEALREMQSKLKTDITATQRLASENLRIRYALDSVSARVMIADTQHNIIYVNDMNTKLFRQRMQEIRRDLPNFDPEKLQGGNLDLFHKNPAHQRNMLERMSGSHRTQIKIGGLTLQLVANPIFDASGERLGSVIEWTDQTEELKIEQEVTALVEGVINGDLTQRIATDELEGFYQRLGEGINGMVEQLQTLIGQITESVDAINTGAREIAVGNSDLSQRTEEQASSLEETASSMEELTSTVKQNADNARQAKQLANNARDVAEQGGNNIGRAVEAMQAITRSSDKISDIITVIDGIAFQTNILALNAAVEAARAGEQGRGFAVVAGEVRNLAQRSASAAKEIKGLIAENATTIGSGSTLVQQAGQTMGDIVTQAKQVSDIIAEIAAASEEQRTGIEQVNIAIAQMDEVTQQNASLVEQAAAASESLEEQAQALTQAVSIFQTHQQPAAKPTQRALPSARKSAAQSMPKRKSQSSSEELWEQF